MNIKAKYCLRSIGLPQVIKNTAHLEAGAGLFPAYSASGQDVWTDNYVYDGDAIVLSAVGARCGKIFHATGKWGLCANTHVLLVDQKIVDIKYISYILNNEEWWIKGGTAQPFVRVYDSLEQKIYLPSLELQQTIVRYLDSKCSAIDEAIERHKKIIEKLEEYKTSVSSQAVLHGIASNTPVKASGVEWIDEIPLSWDIKRGKYLFYETSARSEDGKEELLTVSQYTGITPRSQKNVTMFEAESLVGYKICEIGDIPANTMWLWAGAIGVSKYFGVISPSYNVYRQIGHAYDGEYLDYMLRSVPLVQHYKAKSTGIRPSRLRLYPPQFLDIKFPIPPLEEQKEIVAFLKAKFQTINNAIEHTNKMIAKLEEYRKSIIYNAVTGKIDCREAVK